MSVQAADYPVRFEVDYPRRLSRLLIFVKWLLVIPHYIALMCLGLGAALVSIVAWCAVLVTGCYPRGMFDFMVGVHRWGLRVTSYQFLQTDRYPPFSLADDRAYPVRLEVEYPERVARWRPLVAWVLVIPAAIASTIAMYIAYAAVLVGWLLILITGNFPSRLFRIVTVSLRWQTYVNCYAYFMSTRYPRLSWDD